jgi:hypothetical protein
MVEKPGDREKQRFERDDDCLPQFVESEGEIGGGRAARVGCRSRPRLRW